MATYPNNIYSPREKQNRSGVEYDPEKKTVIFVEDIKKLDDEVVAIQTELGTNFRDSNGNIDLKNKRVINLANPTGSQDAATKEYVDTIKNRNEFMVDDFVGKKLFSGITGSSAGTIDLVYVNPKSGGFGIKADVRVLYGNWSSSSVASELLVFWATFSTGSAWSSGTSRAALLAIGSPVANSLSFNSTGGNNRKITLNLNELYSQYQVEVNFVYRPSTGNATWGFY